ncbi:MAG: 3-dehydroquinate synthase [Caulobacteraceae bacterium]
MIELKVKLQERSYPIFLTDSYTGIGKLISDLCIEGKIAIITDQNVNKHQADAFINNMNLKGYQIEKYIIEGGEKSKSLDTVNNIYDFLLNAKFDRDSTIIALGGGVVGDVAGYAAATFLRGIRLIQVPTSLLAQVDSSVGGKVGVNLRGIKNAIGAFYQPHMVYINTGSLVTLPKRELKAGLAEILVHAIIADPELLDYIENNITRIYSLDKDTLNRIIVINNRIKCRIIELDEREKGLRAILNFGHTIGHAVESIYNTKLLHGECVSIGIVGAFMIACHLGMVDKYLVERIKNLLRKIELPINLYGMDINEVYNKMTYDKKNRNGELVFILPKAIGEVVKCSIQDKSIIKMVLHELSS